MIYCILTYKRRRVIAIPLDYGIGALYASVASLPDSTYKRKLFKVYALFWAFALWLALRLGIGHGNTLPPLDDNLVRRIRGFCPEAMAVVPIWSLVPGRPRSYFRVFGAGAREIGFAKVSTSGPGRERLETEAMALEKYRTAVTFKCPQTIALDVSVDAVTLVTAALPASSRLLQARDHQFPAAIQREIQGEVVLSFVSELRQAGWYRQGLDRNKANNGFYRFIEDIPDHSAVQVGPAHGDFGSENFFADRAGHVFLIDWEHYSEKAPILTDVVGFWIGKHHRVIQSGAVVVARNFAQSFLDATEADLALALLYLSAFDVTDSMRLAALWKN